MAAVLLIVGLILKGIFGVIRLRQISDMAVLLLLGIPALYVAALMVSALPIQAIGLWATIAFIPAAIYAILRWGLTKAVVRR